jgi:carbon-monoxide dehydrogenase catalytic subunit
MEFIQKKTADSAVEYFLPKAAEEGISLVWDRFEGQLPECGFCETGLSCRDCLLGPCISHPFRDSNKLGICGKDKDILASQSLLRLVLKGTMAYLDRLTGFATGVEGGNIKAANKTRTGQVLREIQRLLKDGGSGIKRDFPRALLQRWEETGIAPEGIGRDVFKASQKLEGGVAGVEENLLWSFKSSLLASMARRLHGQLKAAVFETAGPAKVEVNLGVLKKETPNILLCGYCSPILKQKIAGAAKKGKVGLVGLCTDPLLPSHSIPPVTNYISQEIPLLTGAVDLIVAGDQLVSPSLAMIAEEKKIPVISTETLKPEKNLDNFARQIVERTRKSFEFRRSITRDIPEARESAVLGFSAETIGVKKILDALSQRKIKGIAILSGSSNVKFTQDRELSSITREFLKNDILCLSEGEASIGLAKYGFLNPEKNSIDLGKGLSGLIRSLGNGIPPVIDLGSSENGRVIELLLSLAKVGKRDLRDYPLFACFAEASRTTEVVEAMGLVAMGISTYFWPALPVTGSPKTMEALAKSWSEKFGSRLHIPLEKKMEPGAKAALMIKNLEGAKGPRLSGHPWK